MDFCLKWKIRIETSVPVKGQCLIKAPSFWLLKQINSQAFIRCIKGEGRKEKPIKLEGKHQKEHTHTLESNFLISGRSILSVPHSCGTHALTSALLSLFLFPLLICFDSLSLQPVCSGVCCCRTEMEASRKREEKAVFPPVTGAGG